MVLGAVLVALLTETSPVLAVAGATFVIGVGFGLSSAPTIVAVQSVVDWQRRGVVTGTNLFCRNLGSAVGVAVFGAIVNATLADQFAHPPGSVAGRLPERSEAERLVLDGDARPGAVDRVPAVRPVRRLAPRVRRRRGDGAGALRGRCG